MKDIVLVSEIHPLGIRQFHPLKQFASWYPTLLKAEDMLWFQSMTAPPGFDESIRFIAKRCAEKGKHLIVRDWTHLDYTGVPFMPPTGRLMTGEALAKLGPTRAWCTVRHPIDQWLSIRSLPIMREKLEFEAFMRGYAEFAVQCARIGFMRYEDFVREPIPRMRSLCESLGVPFDPTFADRWSTYSKVTGDPPGGRGGKEIRPVPRRPVEPGLIERFEKNADYARLREILGYGHPE